MRRIDRSCRPDGWDERLGGERRGTWAWAGTHRRSSAASGRVQKGRLAKGSGNPRKTRAEGRAGNDLQKRTLMHGRKSLLQLIELRMRTHRSNSDSTKSDVRMYRCVYIEAFMLSPERTFLSITFRSHPKHMLDLILSRNNASIDFVRYTSE